MPIIKDKYAAKGLQNRSKYLTRSNNTAINIDPVNTTLNTQQKQSEKTQIVRAIEQPTILTELKDTKITRKITGHILSTVNSFEEIAHLEQGESLSNILISGTTSVISLYWSTSPFEDISVSVVSGIVNTIDGATIIRLLSVSLTDNVTISLSENNGLKDFGNFSKDVYIYAVSNTAGQNITIIKV